MRSAQNPSLVALSDGPILLLFHKFIVVLCLLKKSTWPLLTFGKSHSPDHHTVSNIVDLSISDIKRCPKNCVLVFTIFHVGTVFFLSVNNAKTTEEFGVSSFSHKHSQKIFLSNLVVSPITVGYLAFLFNCTPVGRASDSMTVPT